MTQKLKGIKSSVITINISQDQKNLRNISTYIVFQYYRKYFKKIFVNERKCNKTKLNDMERKQMRVTIISPPEKENSILKHILTCFEDLIL